MHQTSLDIVSCSSLAAVKSLDFQESALVRFYYKFPCNFSCLPPSIWIAESHRKWKPSSDTEPLPEILIVCFVLPPALADNESIVYDGYLTAIYQLVSLQVCKWSHWGSWTSLNTPPPRPKDFVLLFLQWRTSIEQRTLNFLLVGILSCSSRSQVLNYITLGLMIGRH